MKKIAVLTDLSEIAAHAAAYAFYLASALTADLVLYHSFPASVEEPEGLEEKQKRSEVGLQTLSVKVRLEGERLPAGAYLPAIETRCYEGGRELELKGIDDHRIFMLVAGTHDDDQPANHLRTLTDRLKLPLLVVPLQSAYPSQD